jgi:hypothetical protein
MVDTVRRDHKNDTAKYNDLRGAVFYYDEHHPDGDAGHRVMSELLFHLVGACDMPAPAGQATGLAGRSRRAAPLPLGLAP